jgi:hypothetical protein
MSGRVIHHDTGRVVGMNVTPMVITPKANNTAPLRKIV